MDLVLLRSLVAVADAGTITEAAGALHVSQSALSRRLQQLEADLGTELLVRGRQGVELTALGRETVEEGRSIVAHYDRVRHNIVAQQNLESGTVRIGGGATVTSFVLPARIAEFQAEHPGIRFYVKEAGSSEIAAAVANDDLELGVVTLPLSLPGLATEPILVDEIVLVARPDHPLRSRATLRPADLQGHAFVAFEPASAIRHIIDATLRAAGVSLDIVMELRSIPTILKMVSTTGALAFVSRTGLSSEPELVTLAVRGLSITRTLGLVTRRPGALSPPARAFAQLVGHRS